LGSQVVVAHALHFTSVLFAGGADSLLLPAADPSAFLAFPSGCWFSAFPPLPLPLTAETIFN